MARLAEFFRRVAAGTLSSSVTVDARHTATAATAIVTCATVAAADTVTINGVVFTAVDADAGANEFLQTGTNTADATALAAAINASTTAGVKDVVVATSNGAAVTVASVVPGLVGNAIQIKSSDGTTLAVTGTATRDSDTYLSGGAETRVSVSV